MYTERPLALEEKRFFFLLLFFSSRRKYSTDLGYPALLRQLCPACSGRRPALKIILMDLLKYENTAETV